MREPDDTHSDDESLRYLRALGDPDRLKIVQALRAGPKSVGDICRDVDSPMANVSHHLHALKDAGIVSANKRGRFVIYQLDHVVENTATGTHILDFGCCRIEFGGDGRAAQAVKTPRPEDQALQILNRMLQRASSGGADAAGTKSIAPSNGKADGQWIAIANASFEEPSTPFFDTSVPGWQKEGDPSGTGVFRNFPDDTPVPGSRQVRNADGEQLATIGAQNPGAGRASGLSQALAGSTYAAGTTYTLSIGVGVSSVQPPTSDGQSAPKLRLAMTFTDDAGRRHEVAAQSVSPMDLSNEPRLVEVSVTTTPKQHAPCVGRTIGILICTADNTPGHAGHFILDLVTIRASRAGTGSGRT